MRKLVSRGMALAAGVAMSAAGGVTMVSAASPSSTASPSSSASSSTTSAHPGLRWLRRHRVAGEVVSDSSTGGSLNLGQLVIKEPDGTEITLTLASRTKAWKYQGHGTKPVAESPSSLPTREVVEVVGWDYRDHPVAVRILDLGFEAND
jgi:hypothetical protein